MHLLQSQKIRPFYPTCAKEQVLFEASKCTALHVSFILAQAPEHSMMLDSTIFVNNKCSIELDLMICSKKSNTGFPIEQKVSIFQIILEDIVFGSFLKNSRFICLNCVKNKFKIILIFLKFSLNENLS